MKAKGVAQFMAAISGVSKKTGKPFRGLKFLDDEAEEFFTFFVEEALFEECKSLEKRTPVLLTLELAIGSRFVKLVSIEVLEA